MPPLLLTPLAARRRAHPTLYVTRTQMQCAARACRRDAALRRVARAPRSSAKCVNAAADAARHAAGAVRGRLLCACAYAHAVVATDDLSSLIAHAAVICRMLARFRAHAPDTDMMLISLAADAVTGATPEATILAHGRSISAHAEFADLVHISRQVR